MIERIGFGRRLLAAILDFWIAGFCTLIIVYFGFFEVVQSLQSNVQEISKTPNPAQLGDTLVSGMTGLWFALFLLMSLYISIEAFTGASPAKMLFGIKIGNSDGTPAARKTLMARFLIKQPTLVSTLLAFLTSLSFFDTLGTILGLIIFFGFFLTLGQSRQALHDKLSNTAVFRSDSLRKRFNR